MCKSKTNEQNAHGSSALVPLVLGISDALWVSSRLHWALSNGQTVPARHQAHRCWPPIFGGKNSVFTLESNDWTNKIVLLTEDFL